MDASPTAQLLTNIFGYARDLAVIGFIVLLSWKGRGFYDEATTFIQEIRTFMTNMNNHAEVVVNNHLDHLEKSGARIEKTLSEQSVLLTTISKQRRTPRK